MGLKSFGFHGNEEMTENHTKTGSHVSWRERINFNTVCAMVFIILWTIMFLITPDQIAKPKLFMGRALMGLKPTLFPRLAISREHHCTGPTDSKSPRPLSVALDSPWHRLV